MTPNSLAFVALCNEYCSAVEHAAHADSPLAFVEEMLRLLPRLYIAATDLRPEPAPGDSLDPLESQEETAYIENSLDEEYYDSLRRSMEGLLGENDMYVEVFEEDMRFSETPIAASIAENLADIFQPLYNLLEVLRDAPDALVASALTAAKEDFSTYWCRPLCNVMRALNNVRYFAL